VNHLGDRRTAGGLPAQVGLLDPLRVADHADRLHRAALGLCGNRHDAEDLVQETVARVLARPRRLHNADELAYLVCALRNTFLVLRARAARRPILTAIDESLLETQASAAVSSVDASVSAHEVLRAVAELPPHARDVIVAVDLAGLSYADAARSLAVPEGTVMSRLHRARERVARRLA
jgi:RNA polymerase sigma-70 factor, ECF subfamily